LELPKGGTREVPLLDVADPKFESGSTGEQVLPLGHEFLIAEAFETTLLRENPNLSSPNITFGPVPKDWPTTVAEIPQSLHEALNELQLELSMKTLGDSHRWELYSTNFGTETLVTQWRTHVERISEIMANSPRSDDSADTYSAVKQLPLQVPAQAQRPVAQRETYDWLGVYVDSLDSLTPADQLLREAKLASFNQSVIQRLLKLNDQTRMTLQILLGIGLVVVGLAMWNMFALEYHRNALKVSEIGMLKAMGMTRQWLLKLAIFEATILLICGVLLGLLLGIGMGLGGSFYQYGSEQMLLGFALEPLPLVLGLVVSTCICLVGSVLATYRVHSAPPSESLKGLSIGRGLLGRVFGRN
jgi:hypothetical protein